MAKFRRSSAEDVVIIQIRSSSKPRIRRRRKQKSPAPCAGAVVGHHADRAPKRIVHRLRRFSQIYSAGHHRSFVLGRSIFGFRHSDLIRIGKPGLARFARCVTASFGLRHSPSCLLGPREQSQPARRGESAPNAFEFGNQPRRSLRRSRICKSTKALFDSLYDLRRRRAM